jgi:hypothetical protein
MKSHAAECAMIIAEIKAFPLRIPFKKGTEFDASAWADRDSPAAGPNRIRTNEPFADRRKLRHSICADQCQRTANTAVNLTALKKVCTWDQGAFVGNGGWALMP